MKINIIFPVLNERLRLEKGIRSTVEYLQSIDFKDYCITIVDNGSEDETPEIAERLCEEFPKVTYERIQTRGVGAAFRRGVELNTCEIVGYMDIDLSTNIKHLGEAIEIFRKDESIQYINGSRFAKESDTKGRRWYRKITSRGLLILLKVFLGMKSSDAICGFTFVRKSIAEELIAASSDDNGWFYMIEFLLRAEKRGVKVLDYPVEWQEDYNTTVKIFKTICNYLVQITRLFIEFNIKKNI
ncbi:MAG: glycosyltransferase [Lachnospiraceae bacterium]|nr:glycosyltransferase [Lachnospiraceae bacterium]